MKIQAAVVNFLLHYRILDADGGKNDGKILRAGITIFLHIKYRKNGDINTHSEFIVARRISSFFLLHSASSSPRFSMFHTVIYRLQSSRQKKPITENRAHMLLCMNI